jgi:TolB-like protein/Tfp pilus assembly protein PilF
VALAFLLIGMNVQGWRNRLLAKSRSAPIQSIAVLPLENLTGDPSQDYFADGMTDALITDLAQVGSLRVISRTSSSQYKRTQKLLSQIGRELNVDAVVEGTVVRSGSRVRIDAQLIRADTDQHVWARSYEGDLSQVLTLQSAVAEAISSEVRAKLTPEERARLQNQQTVSPEAYELYLRGNYFLDKRTREGMEKALAYYKEATEKDPSSALAFSGLADAYSLLSGFGFLPAKEADSKGRAAAEKAVSLNASSAEALTALTGFTEDPLKTERLFRRAIEINPSYALAHHWYARFLSENHRYDEALLEIHRARSLDPLSVRIVVNQGEILFLAGELDKALEQLQLALDMDPNFPMTHWALGRSLFYGRHYEASLSHFRRATELNPDAAGFHYWLAATLEFLGRYREAIAEFDRADVLDGMNAGEASARAAALRRAFSASGEQGYWRTWIALRMKDREKSPHTYAYNIAYDYAHVGDNASAVAWLETCFQEKTCDPVFMRNPGLDALRSDPRYESLLARMGHP